MEQQNLILLFPNGAPGETEKLIEKENPFNIKVGDLPVRIISDVSEPAITFFPAPEDNNSGTTIIVNPGGGYNVLAYDLEGTEVCELFNSYGINCVLLKYRVPRRKDLPMHVTPLQDLQRAIAYTRAHAEEWNIDENKIGVIGFSAGAFTAAIASNSFKELTYPAEDSFDEMSVRPDFCMLIYPGYLDGENFSVVPELEVTKETCPTFLVQTQDDHKLLNSSLFYYYVLKESKVSVAMHLYPTGYHGYGVRDTGHLVNEWPLRALDWLRDIGMMGDSEELRIKNEE
ncbi:MAG: alpha/beta hydrolase, partial [Dysgonamonadaceae bacterium]|nr:alpha/beta hydrolase [Dysgonamonadaceae bacterium]MDD4247183.1 alpha/beta hydrolase [Dysgonamonadaceae bacterium]HUI32755.1 alpha/beta hydrolase [Dysgonamonadaceae bacterium]